MPINETHDFQLGWHAASFMFCLALLLLALRIIFSSAVKGYFASPPNSALNRYEQANLPPAG
jgi:hypothetical protein